MAGKLCFKSQRGLDRRGRGTDLPDEGRAGVDAQVPPPSLDIFVKRPMPTWGGDLTGIDFDNIFYYIKPSSSRVNLGRRAEAKCWRRLTAWAFPKPSVSTWPAWPRSMKAKQSTTSVREDFQKLGVIFTDMDTALRVYPDLMSEYLGAVIPPADNKFAALNSAVWSGG